MSYDNGGCKLTIKDKTSKEEILNALALFLTKLEEDQGIEEFSNINIYFQIYKDGDKQILVDKNDPTKTHNEFIYKLIEHNNHKTIENLEDGSKKITFNKEVNLERIKDTINKVKTEQNKNSQMISISTMKYKIALAMHEVKQEELIEKARQQRLIRQEQERIVREERNKKEQAEKDLLNSFKDSITKKMNIDRKMLAEITTSIGYITEEKTMLKYINQEQIPVEHKVIRATFKNRDTKEITHTEIYNLNFELIK